VDTSGPQVKAPFNQIKNEARVFSYEDTAIITSNSDTPYSILWLDLRAESVVLSVPAVEKDSSFDLAGRRGNVEVAGYRAGELIFRCLGFTSIKGCRFDYGGASGTYRWSNCIRQDARHKYPYSVL
jgi:hypothetical protein